MFVGWTSPPAVILHEVCLLLQMKCRTGLMRLPLINKDDTLVAVWHLLNFPTHQRHPTVVHLTVQLEGGQRVYYEPGQPAAHLTDTPPKTTLTAFFYLCKTDPLAKTLLYSEVPRHFCWDASQKVWQIRKKGVPLADFPGYVTHNALGRVYTVHPNNREAFHVHLLLHHVRGPISFEDLKTVVVRDEDGDILEIKSCSTYTEACQVLGLLEDDSHLYQAMEEAAVSQSPAQLSNLCHLVAVCGLNKPILEDKILSITGHKLALYGLPEPVQDQPELTSKDVLRETSFDVQTHRAYMAANVPRLTPDQQQAFIALTGMIRSERGGIAFVDAPLTHRQDFSTQFAIGFCEERERHGCCLLWHRSNSACWWSNSTFGLQVATGLGQIRQCYLQYF
ncbi:ATP-dependent DNA helicase [Trichonephila clavata]|uniref:ATP-dependent DNA helicase n=1 Tax=Trichonephila clavata TaxID=2740835 RepID=A0A8X6H5Y8_TRICU|nr:ATP-dependent DNA helicase [Trichonephila clavata]